MARSETSPLLHGVRRGIDSHVVDLDGPSGESKVFGASKRTRAWMLAGVTAVVGTVAVAGVGAEGMRSALGSAAGVGMADSMAWRPGAAFVSAPSALPSLGNDKWAAYVQQGSDSGNNDVAAIGEDERDPNTMLHQWDQVVKWGSGLNPNDNQGNHPGLYDPVDPTIPFESDVDRQSAHLTWDQAKQLGYIMTPESFKAAIQAHPTSFLVIHAVNGLGNRMRALAAGKCLARERNRKLIIVWERDDSLEAPLQSMLTPSFLRGSFILETLPYNFLAAEHEKLTKQSRGEPVDKPPSFSLIHDATTDWGKQRVSIETAPDAWANWKGAAYIKSSHAELQLTASEYNFVGSYMVYFQPSAKVSAMMKTVPLADKSDDQVVSMHIRAGEDAKLSKDLKLDGEAAAEVALVDSYRQQCTVNSFVDVLTKRAPDAVSRGISVFVAADKPEDVAALRARLPNNKVFALSRPDYCNYGYNKAREEECMVYAVADLFLLSRNPGPMLRSKFSSFSDFANYYRKRAGRLQGKGFLVNGCDDDGHGEDGVLTAAAEASLGALQTTLSAPLEKRAFSDVVKARFAMGVEGGGHYKIKLGTVPVVNGDASRLGAETPAVSLCDAHADHVLCRPQRDMNQMEGFFAEMKAVSKDEAALSKLGLNEGETKSKRAPFVVELNALLGSKPAAAAYPTPQSTAANPVFPEVRVMARAAEANGVDFTVAALYRDPVEAVARTASLSKPVANGQTQRALAEPVAGSKLLDRVIGSFSKQSQGYREMSAQLAAVSRDFYQCHSMDDDSSAAGGSAVGGSSSKAAGWVKGPARALLASREEKEEPAGSASADLGAGTTHDPLEPQVLAAYDSLGADAFYWFSAFSKDVRAASSSDAFASTLSVAMRDRVELLRRVQQDLGRNMNKVEMARYVGAENDAYAAYFAFRTGVCR
jgi:hypothetical protein